MSQSGDDSSARTGEHHWFVRYNFWIVMAILLSGQTLALLSVYLNRNSGNLSYAIALALMGVYIIMCFSVPTLRMRQAKRAPDKATAE